MAAVQQRVLNWLYSVLTSEYHDVNRVYNDTAQVLSNYPSLAPKTDVYTYENGTSVLLLNLSGTIPAAFRGMTYNFPISLWIPHAYPMEAPMAYVTPTEGMVVRAGQHVDPQGKVYHPYLAAWPEFWDRYNAITFIAILRDVFAKEPPVIARQQSAPQRPPSMPPPRPPLPSNINGSPAPAPASSTGPAPPPKPSQNAPERVQSPGSYAQPRENQGPPPLPPLPPQLRGASPQSSPVPQRSSIYGQNMQPQRQSSLRYENPPPLPQPTRQQSMQDSSPRFTHPMNQDRYSQQPSQNYSGSQYTGPPQPPPGYVNQAQHYPNQPPQFRQPSPQQAPPPPTQHKPPPPADLLDAPLTLLQPPDLSNVPAPPIPPNPEKDALLQTLARTLHANRLQNTNLSITTIPSLASQNKAMLTALQSMQAEMEALTNLSNSLTSNTQILQNSLQNADEIILSSKSQKPPSIDDILVAPTTVANQLYDLVCEERALGDTLFVLGRAVERGRISGPTFVKMTRALAREWFLKKALIKKIAKGMGLEGGSLIS